MNSPSPAHRRPSPAAILIIIPLAVALVLTLFAWPSAKLEPRDVPVGVAGAPAAATAIERQLAARDGAFETHRYSDERNAREAIQDREVYGAFVATPAGPKVLTSTAASPAVAQLLNHAAVEAKAPVEDVVSAKPGSGALAASVLPLVLAGLLTGLAGAALGASALQRAGLVVGGSILAGLTATAVIQGWLDVIGGDWLVNAGALSLTVLAVAAIVAGLDAARQGGRGARGADHGADRQPVLRRRHRPGDAAGRGRVARSAPAAGRRRQPAPQHRPVRRRRGRRPRRGALPWALAGLGLLFVSAARGRRTAPALVPAAA